MVCLTSFPYTKSSAEKPFSGIDLQEKEEDKEENHTEKLIR